jgi:hypothetical protein
MKPEPSNARVLFIGNSHTYYHDMPQMIAALAQAAGQGNRLSVEMCTGHAVNLKWHWHNRPTRDLIAKGGWDYVVLQERSGGPLQDEASMLEYARLLDAEIKTIGARTVFYMTWAQQDRPDTQRIVTAAYEQITRELGAILAPVGSAWENALQADSGFGLHGRDRRHANPAGSYLAACVFFAVFFNISPEGLPGHLTFNDKVLVDITADSAFFLQRIAFETVYL